VDVIRLGWLATSLAVGHLLPNITYTDALLASIRWFL
jgi:hypothetical protein